MPRRRKTYRSFRNGWLARSSLLVAALSFFFSAVLDPAAHGRPAPGDGVVTLSIGALADGPSGENGPGLHDEFRCAVCQALAGVAVPDLAPAPAVITVSVADPASVDVVVPPAEPPAGNRARAPPLT